MNCYKRAFKSSVNAAVLSFLCCCFSSGSKDCFLFVVKRFVKMCICQHRCDRGSFQNCSIFLTAIEARSCPVIKSLEMESLVIDCFILHLDGVKPYGRCPRHDLSQPIIEKQQKASCLVALGWSRWNSLASLCFLSGFYSV